MGASAEEILVRTIPDIGGKVSNIYQALRSGSDNLREEDEQLILMFCLRVESDGIPTFIATLREAPLRGEVLEKPLRRLQRAVTQLKTHSEKSHLHLADVQHANAEFRVALWGLLGEGYQDVMRVLASPGPKLHKPSKKETYLAAKNLYTSAACLYQAICDGEKENAYVSLSCRYGMCDSKALALTRSTSQSTLRRNMSKTGDEGEPSEEDLPPWMSAEYWKREIDSPEWAEMMRDILEHGRGESPSDLEPVTGNEIEGQKLLARLSAYKERRMSPEERAEFEQEAKKGMAKWEADERERARKGGERNR